MVAITLCYGNSVNMNPALLRAFVAEPARWKEHTAERAKIRNGRVALHLRADDGTEREVVTEHVIAATGYKVDMDRLKFVSPEIRSSLKLVGGSPVLSSGFESSVPGLYFAGLTAANSFGPVMRFAYGAGFAARTLTRAVSKALEQEPAPASAPERHELREVKMPQAREKVGAASGS